MNDVPFELDSEALAGLIPDCYAEFRPLVMDAFGFFLQHLSPSRLAGVLEAQAALPADAGISERLVRVLHGSPALHKLGQVIARDRRLDPTLRLQLQRLESMEPQTPMDLVRPMLHSELAPSMDKYQIRIDEHALAEASVAAVVPITWRDPQDSSSAAPRQGVVKVLKPGIAQQLDEDLDLLGRLADYVESRQSSFGLPDLAYREIFDEVADLLAHEVRCEQEQEHLRTAGRQLADVPDVQVPALLPFSTPRLTAMERVFGRKVADLRAAWPWQRPAMFASIARAMLARVMFCDDESVLYHGDPHAGNLFATPDGRLAILDWSLTGRLTSHDRESLAKVVTSAMTLDAPGIARAIEGLLRRPAPEALVRRHVDEALATLRGPRLAFPGPTWTMNLLDRLAIAGVRFPPRLMLFRKAFFTLTGVLHDVYPGGSLDWMLMTEAVHAFARDLPLRFMKGLGASDYATHMSSGELLRVAAAAPSTVWNWWKPLWPPLGH